MKKLLLTNNSMVQKAFEKPFQVVFIKGTFLDVLMKARDYVHLGHTLLTHPLSGSVKPNQTPYKSLLIGEKENSLSLDSLQMIEGALMTCEKFPLNPTPIPREILLDYQQVDLALISGAISTLR